MQRGHISLYRKQSRGETLGTHIHTLTQLPHCVATCTLVYVLPLSSFHTYSLSLVHSFQPLKHCTGCTVSVCVFGCGCVCVRVCARKVGNDVVIYLLFHCSRGKPSEAKLNDTQLTDFAADLPHQFFSAARSCNIIFPPQSDSHPVLPGFTYLGFYCS